MDESGKWSRPEKRRETAMLKAAKGVRAWWTGMTSFVKAMTGLVAAVGTTAVAVAALWPASSSLTGSASAAPPGPTMPVGSGIVAAPVMSSKPTTATTADPAPCLGDGCGPEFYHAEREHWDQLIVPPDL